MNVGRFVGFMAEKIHGRDLSAIPSARSQYRTIGEKADDPPSRAALRKVGTDKSASQRRCVTSRQDAQTAEMAGCQLREDCPPFVQCLPPYSAPGTFPRCAKPGSTQAGDVIGPNLAAMYPTPHTSSIPHACPGPTNCMQRRASQASAHRPAPKQHVNLMQDHRRFPQTCSWNFHPNRARRAKAASSLPDRLTSREGHR
jgi:hypothetical protein